MALSTDSMKAGKGTVHVKALRDCMASGQALRVDGEYDISERDYRILVGSGKVEACEKKAPKKKAAKKKAK